MNLLSISLTNLCDNDCIYCPIPGRWKNRPELNRLTNDSLFAYLDKYLTHEANEWIIELTGGEPGLYEGINELVAGLTSRGFWGVVKTNGKYPIQKTTNFPLISAWHANQTEPPKHYNVVLIIKNPDDDWQKKERYCKDNAIPYNLVDYSPAPTGQYPLHFIKIMSINSYGQITPLPMTTPRQGLDIFNAVTNKSKIIDFIPYEFYAGISYKPAHDVFIFLSQELQKLVEKDYLESIGEASFPGGLEWDRTQEEADEERVKKVIA
jgi:hypothetical protein